MCSVLGGIDTQKRVAGSDGNSILNFLRNLHTVFHSVCTSLHSHQQWMRVPFFPQHLQHLLLLVLLIIAILTAVRWYHIVVLICVSLIAYEVENLFAYLLAICMFSREKCLFRCPARFSIGLFVCLVLSCMCSLCIFDIYPLSELLCANIFWH